MGLEFSSRSNPIKQKWPHHWGHDAKRQKVGQSGKAMQGTIPHSGTVVQEVKRRIEESGHAKVAASLLSWIKALPAPKPRASVITRTQVRKQLEIKGLHEGFCGFEKRSCGRKLILEVQNNAHSLQSATCTQNASPARLLIRSGLMQKQQLSSCCLPPCVVFLEGNDRAAKVH